MEFRKVVRISPNGFKTEIKFSQLRRGDRFTLNDGESGSETGKTVYTAGSDAYPVQPDGNFAVIIA